MNIQGISSNHIYNSSSYHKRIQTSSPSMVQRITSCIVMVLIATQSASASQNSCLNQSLVPSKQLSLQNGYVCPLIRTENMQLVAYELEKEYGQKIDVELFDAELMQFQESVINILNSQKNSYKHADVGVHKSPILFDADTNEPIGIIKGQKGQWFVTCAIGDVIAYKLDHNGYAKVPPAFEITSFQDSNGERMDHPEGVIVKWVSNTHQITNQELRTANLEKRQAISILDIRLGNKDRNLGNIQVGSDGELFPIDHDQIFTKYERSAAAHAIYSERPLTEKAKNYIHSIDVNDDIEILRQHNIDEGEIANLVIRTTFLKLAAEATDSEEINLEYVEDAIANAKLPTGGAGEFIQSWIYDHPLRKILRGVKEPYNENQLKEAFRDAFHSYIASAKRWSYSTFLIKRIARAIF